MRNDTFVLGAGLSHELELAMNREGIDPWTPELVHAMTKGTILNNIRQLLLGNATMLLGDYTVDLDTETRSPFSHTDRASFSPSIQSPLGKVILNDKKVLVEKFSSGHDDPITIRVFKAKLQTFEDNGFVLGNAALLEFYLRNQILIPPCFRHDPVAFWGTSYFNKERRLYVRILRPGRSEFSELCDDASSPSVMALPVAMIDLRGQISAP